MISGRERLLRKGRIDAAEFWLVAMRVLRSMVGVPSRVVLVLGSFVSGLWLFDALLRGLGWIVTGDERELAGAAGFLAKATVSLVAIAAGAYGRERLRRTLETRRKLVEAGPWAQQVARREPLLLNSVNFHGDNDFDTLRIVAAIAVLVSNSIPIAYGKAGVQPLAALSRGQTNLGTVAVLVLFVVSGYLITRSFDRRPTPLRFLKARVLRIFPGLSLALILTAGVLGPLITPLPLAPYLTDFDTSQYVYGGLSLVWMQYDLPGVFEGNPAGGVINGSLWVLEYEFLMYVVVLGLGTARLLNRNVVLWLWIGALVLSWSRVGGNYLAFGTPFLSGAVLYLWRDRIPLDWRLALLSAVALGDSMVTGSFRLAFATFGAYLLIYLALAPSVRLPNLARWGNLSYGIYIFAWPIQQTVAFLLGPAVTWYWDVALALPAILSLAWVSWHFLEKPALSLNHSGALARTAQH